MAEPALPTAGRGPPLQSPPSDGVITATVGPGVDGWHGDGGEASPVGNKVESLPVPLPNVPAQLNNNIKQENRHLPIPQAPQVPMSVNKRHVPVPHLPQAPIQVVKRTPPANLPVKATFLQMSQTTFSPNTAPVPVNKRHLQVPPVPQMPATANRTPAHVNRPPTTNNVSLAAKKSWPAAMSSGEPGSFGQRQWSVQHQQAGKRHLPVHESPKPPPSNSYKRERENRNNVSFGLKEPPPMYATANKLKTNRNVDRAGLEEALLGQERRPMLKSTKTNPYQFVLQDHNYGAPPPLSPPGSPPGVGPPTLDGERPSWAPGALYRPRVDDDAASAISSERGREVEPEGEETETAPEGEGDEDAVTRCICDFQHDDGYMVRCDKCFVWQHLDCMGLDRDNPPKAEEEYLCERCKPRPVERHKARTLQMRKREEIANDSSSDSSSSTFTDDNARAHAHPNRPNMPGNMGPKKRAQASAGGRRKSEPTNPRKPNNNAAVSAGKQPQQQQQRQRHQAAATAAAAANSSKEQQAVQRRASTPGSRKNNQPPREKRAVVRRKSKAASSRASEDETSQEDWSRPADKLRTWIDNYEEAVTNHYSPELRAKVSSIKVNGLHSGATGLHNVPNLTGKCVVRMIEPGVKVLQAFTHIASNQPVIELRGKHMLATQHKPNPVLPAALGKRTRPYVPCVFFYRLPKDDTTEVCVDSRTYGNDARFVRRSCKPNSEVWHCMEKGTLHLYIVSTCVIERNVEITIAHDKMADPPARCVCGSPRECTANPRYNGAHPPAAEPKVEDQKERRKRRGRRTRSTSAGDKPAVKESPPVRASRERPRDRPILRRAKEPPAVKPAKEVAVVKSVEPSPPAGNASPPKIRRTLSREPRPVRVAKEAPVVKEAPPVAAPVVPPVKPAKVMKEKPTASPLPVHPRPLTPRAASPPVLAVAPMRRTSNPRTPVKSDGEQDDSEEKKAEDKDSRLKTREERKIEAIMKAFERMERETKRKTDNQTKHARRKDTPRKDSTELTKEEEEEPVLQPPPNPVFSERPKKRRRKGRGRTNSATTPTPLPKRRRTRFHSGQSDSDSNDAASDHKMGPPFSSPSVSTAAGLLMALSQQNNGHCYAADKLLTPSPPPGGVPSQFDSGCSSSSSHSSVTPTLSSACLLVAAAVGPLAPGFKFPKTKKGLMNEWLNKSPEFPPTPSPTLPHPYPHLGGDEGFPYGKSLDTLAQAAIATSPNKENHGSAKKRWLRQVMSQEGDGSGSPNSRAGSPPCPDYVTPLKKRRLARESQSSEQSFTPPHTPTEQRSPDHAAKTDTQKGAEEDDPTTSPDERNEDDDEDVTRRVARLVAKPSENSVSTADEAKSPSSDSESRGGVAEPRGTCEIVTVPNTPSLSRADSPQSPRADSGISVAQLAQMQREIHKQLNRSQEPEEDDNESKEENTSDGLSDRTEHSSPDDDGDRLVNDGYNSDGDLDALARTAVEAVNAECQVEQDDDDDDDDVVTVTTEGKVGEASKPAMNLDSEMEEIFKGEGGAGAECDDKVVEMKKVHLAKEEAKIAKRKLSISEYRQRKQLDNPAGPNASPAPRGRSNSSSSSTGSSSSLSDEEAAKQPPVPDLPAFLPPFADPGDDKKGLGEELGNKLMRFDSAPTQVESQRENLMQRLRREFGLFLTDETDPSKLSGVVLDPLIDIDETRRGVPPPPMPLDAAPPPRATFPFQTKPPANCNDSTYNHNSVNYISTITGNRPHSTYPGGHRCPPGPPGRYPVPYSMTGNFQSAPPGVQRDLQGGQTLPFGISRGGSKPFHTVAAAKAYFPHVNHTMHDRE